MTEIDSTRFWSKVDKSGECWEWMAARQSDGYGVIGTHERTYRAHRVAWTLANGPIPDGRLVCHHCDNRGCVRPSHLFIGSVRDNALDKAIKGRTNRAKLTPDIVRSMRSLAAHGDQLIDIAAHCGVTVSTVSDVVARRLWAHVDGDGIRVVRKRRSQRT